MKHWYLKLAVLLVLLTSPVLLTAGCGVLGDVNQTQISVQVSGKKLLHMAAVPKTLPDGTDATEQLGELLEEVARRAGGYTYIDNVRGGWVPPGQSDVVQEQNGLLIVEGDAALGKFLQDELRDEFQQEHPFVISVPSQPYVIIRPVAPMAGPAAAAE